jgi:hypothetical protein
LGRRPAEDDLEPLTRAYWELGEQVSAGEPLCRLHARHALPHRRAGFFKRPHHSSFNLIAQIRLAQDDDRTSTTLPGNDQVTFNPSWVEVLIQRGDQENSIDV